jgi:hypothetical protein
MGAHLAHQLIAFETKSACGGRCRGMFAYAVTVPTRTDCRGGRRATTRHGVGPPSPIVTPIGCWNGTIASTDRPTLRKVAEPGNLVGA